MHKDLILGFKTTIPTFATFKVRYMKAPKLLFAIFCIISSALLAQDSAQVIAKTGGVFHSIFHKENYGKNTIKCNPMASTLFADKRNIAFSYERNTYRNQSASIGGGLFYFPTLLDRSVGAVVIRPRSSSGFILTADYRFYLHQLNTRPAPNGVYIGPFYSVYHHQGGVDFEYLDESGSSAVLYNVELNSKFTFQNVGFQLGYQFIFWKRLSLDLILFGPAVTYYNIELDVNSNMSQELKNQINQKYQDSFFSKYPVFEELLDKATFSKSGVRRGTSVNFRYTIQFGYHF